MNNTIVVSFRVTPEIKEQIDRLFSELNRPVPHDELLVLLLQAYYKMTAEAALSTASQIVNAKLEKEIVSKPESEATGKPEVKKASYRAKRELSRDYTDYRSAQVRLSGRPAYTKYGLYYSPAEPRVNL